MWEAIAAGIKAITNKNLIPLVVAIIAGIATIIILPLDNWMIIKVGRGSVGTMVGGMFFLLTCFLESLLKKVEGLITKMKNDRSYAKIEEQQLEQDIHKLWLEIDNLSKDDKEALYTFLKTDNQAIEREFFPSYAEFSLWESIWVVSTSNSGKRMYGEVRQFKLDDTFYKLLKYSYEKYGKISNFD